MPEKTKCDVCGTTETKMWMRQGRNILCDKCSHDRMIAHLQSVNNNMTVLAVLMQTYFRRGKGEDVTFEDVWEEHERDAINPVKLLKTDDIYDIGHPGDPQK